MVAERQELTPPGLPGRSDVARRRSLLRLAAPLAALLLFLPATSRADGGFSQDAARKIFATGLDNMASVYIRKVNLGNFSVEALKGLSTIDPSFNVEQRAGRIHLTVASAGVADFTAPGDDNAGGWAELIARAIAAARAHSYPINAESPEKLSRPCSTPA